MTSTPTPTDHSSPPSGDPGDDLVVHTPCGALRGPVQVTWRGPLRPVVEQQCDCQPRERWPGVDVSHAYDLCQVCARGLAGGTGRWAWLVCDTCRTVLRASDDPRLALAPVGRHSLMNARSVQVAASEREQAVQQAALVRTFADWDDLSAWGRLEAARLAAGLFHGLPEVPLRRWRERAPEGAGASRDAASRFGSWLDMRDA